MNLEDLRKRRAEIHSLQAERVRNPGTGWHKNDPCSPQNKGLPAIDEHLYAFRDRRHTVLIDTCADRARKAIADHAAATAPVLADPYAEHEDRRVAMVVTEYVAMGPMGICPSDPAALTVNNSDWNDILAALKAQGLGVSLS